MKKHLLFTALCLLFNGFSSFGQTAVSTHESPAVVTKTPVLSEISQRITAKESTMITGSRSTVAQSSSELSDLYSNYSKALNEQIRATASETELKELNQELRYSEKRKAELTNR